MANKHCFQVFLGGLYKSQEKLETMLMLTIFFRRGGGAGGKEG